jgi:hypothetical protein
MGWYRNYGEVWHGKCSMKRKQNINILTNKHHPPAKVMSVICMKMLWKQPLYKTVTDRWVCGQKWAYDKQVIPLADIHKNKQKKILLECPQRYYGNSTNAYIPYQTFLLETLS